MNEVFRFHVLRPPDAVSDPDTISTAEESGFQQKLREKVTKEEELSAIQQEALSFISGDLEGSDEYCVPPDLKDVLTAFQECQMVLDNAISQEVIIDLETVKPIIEDMIANAGGRETTLGDQIVGRGRASFREFVADSIIALTILHQENLPIFENMVKYLRLMSLIEKVASEDKTLDAPGAIPQLLNQIVLLPNDIFPLQPTLRDVSELDKSLQKILQVAYSPVVTGAFREVGVADLEVVEQEILRYEMGEIAHVENVLHGEQKVRTHRTMRRTEDYTFTETETTEKAEQDLQSSERFELQREAQKTIREESSLDVGVTVKYGGFVDVEASTKYASKNASEESPKSASNYAREVTTRAVSTLEERALERRALTVISETEETNTHTLSAEDHHVVGIYRWLDKVFNTRVYNYGLRLMYEFIVPEPAVFLLQALANRTPAGPLQFHPKTRTVNH